MFSHKFPLTASRLKIIFSPFLSLSIQDNLRSACRLALGSSNLNYKVVGCFPLGSFLKCDWFINSASSFLCFRWRALWNAFTHQTRVTMLLIEHKLTCHDTRHRIRLGIFMTLLSNTTQSVVKIVFRSNRWKLSALNFHNIERSHVWRQIASSPFKKNF